MWVTPDITFTPRCPQRPHGFFKTFIWSCANRIRQRTARPSPPVSSSLSSVWQRSEASRVLLIQCHCAEVFLMNPLSCLQARARVELREKATQIDAEDVVEIMKHRCLYKPALDLHMFSLNRSLHLLKSITWVKFLNAQALSSALSLIDTYSDEFGRLDFDRSQLGSGMSNRSKAKKFITALNKLAERQQKTMFEIQELRQLAKDLQIQVKTVFHSTRTNDCRCSFIHTLMFVLLIFLRLWILRVSSVLSMNKVIFWRKLTGPISFRLCDIYCCVLYRQNIYNFINVNMHVSIFQFY